MQVELSLDGPPFWTLGDPKSIIIHLSYKEPGPVDLNFDALEDRHQQQVLAAMRAGIVSSDVTFSDLYMIWLQSKNKVPTQEVQKSEQQSSAVSQVANDLQARVLRREQELRIKEEKFQERCLYLSKRSVRGLTKAITDENDERVIRTLLKLEEQGQQRSMIIKHITEKLERLELARAKRIEREVRKQIAADPNTQKTIDLDVIQSELEVVTLTPEDLISTISRVGGEDI